MKQIIYISAILIFISCNHNSSSERNDQIWGVEKAGGEPAEIKDGNLVKPGIKDLAGSPVDVALSFINSYADNCNRMKEALAADDWARSNKISTTNFKKEVKRILEEAEKEEPGIGLGFDPIFDAQDYDDEFELQSFDTNTCFIVVKGKKYQDFTVTLKVVREDGKWLVDGCGIINIPEGKRRQAK